MWIIQLPLSHRQASQKQPATMQFCTFIILISLICQLGAFSIINDERAISLIEKYKLDQEQKILQLTFQKEIDELEFTEELNLDTSVNMVAEEGRVKRKAEHFENENENDELFSNYPQ